MKSYPITIVDDFFEDPDAIRKLGLLADYSIQNERWPGRRSSVYDINKRLFYHFGFKVFSLFGKKAPTSWTMELHFQKINPFSKDKWDKRNRGWVHSDRIAGFGGIVYLNKNPDKDTGTSIYKSKDGTFFSYNHEGDIMRKLYRGEKVDKKEYEEIYDEYHSQFVETVKVDNVYNRLLLFGPDVYHAVRTFGIEERLTMPFFMTDIGNSLTPLQRY